MDGIVTADFSKFGYRELAIAAKLLQLYADEGASFLGVGITVNFNLHSGYVFLSDEDYTVGVLDDKEEHIVQFFSCPQCGYEGTQADALNDCCDFVANQGFCSSQCAWANM